MKLSKKQRQFLFLIILGYVLLAITYALVTPPFEASDEYKHYPVVQHLQTTAKLPILDPDAPGLWLQEAAQPPLYYMLMAGATFWIDSSDLVETHQVNPHAFIGNPNQVKNKNIIIHQPESERFPWQGSILAVYVIRFFTIVFGIGTILVTTRLGTLVFNPQIGLLAGALTAFNPMFLFVNAAVNNDALAILLGSLGLYLLVRLWREAPSPQKHWIRYVVLGLILGLGLLTKLSLAGLLLLTGIALAWLSLRKRDWRFFLVGGTITLAVSIAVLLPWLLQNLRIYGEPTALSVFSDVMTARESPITWQDWKAEFGTFYRSYWGLFGGVNIAAPEIYYWAYNLLALVGVVGFIASLWRLRNAEINADSQVEPPGDSGKSSQSSTRTLLVDEGVWLLIAWAMIIILLLVRWNIITPAFQGRLVFPAISAFSVLLAAGLLSWFRPNIWARITVVLTSLFFIAAALLPWITIKPAYAFPSPIRSVPDDAVFGPISFRSGSGEIQLIGVEVAPDQSVSPGSDPIEVVLYWKTIQAVDQDLLTAVSILGRNNEPVGHVNRFPAWGMVPTSQWQPGQIWRDIYLLFPDDDAEAPSELKARVALYDPERKNDLVAQSPDGLPIDLLIVGHARLSSDPNLDTVPPLTLNAIFDEGISLEGYSINPQPVYPGDPLRLGLYWRSNGTPERDYTVFVQLVDAGGTQFAGADGPPANNDYPTHLWQDGDQIIDEHIIDLPTDLPPAQYLISVGLYDPESGFRLPLRDNSGDAVQLSINVGSER